MSDEFRLASRKRKRKLKRRRDGRAVVSVSPSAAGIIAGDEDPSSWDDEEIFRGQRRDKNGKFKGRPPNVVPQAIHAERMRRTFSEAMRQFQISIPKALKVLVGVLDDPNATNSDRIKAADLIINRVLGKPPENVRVNISAEDPPWLQAIRASLIELVPEEPRKLRRAEVIEVDEILEPDS